MIEGLWTDENTIQNGVYYVRNDCVFNKHLFKHFIETNGFEAMHTKPTFDWELMPRERYQFGEIYCFLAHAEKVKINHSIKSISK